MTRATYSRWERDIERPPFRASALGSLAASEKCILYRRRLKLSQATVARDIGRCRYWVNRLEAGLEDCTELVQYYEC